jgi:predicted kinase
VGAGKSTFGLQLAHGHRAVRLTLDEWMATLFRPDRPAVGVVEWYVERAARCIEQIWALTKQSLSEGIDVILEIGLLRRHEREAFYRRVDDAGFDLTIHVVDAARDIRRQRVIDRNHGAGPTFSMIVPPEIFEYASDLWEPADAAECAGRDVSFIRTDD